MFINNFIVISTLILVVGINNTPLDDYVNKPDSNYKYELIQTYDLTDYKLYILNMTSQKWLNETIIVNSIWWHYLCVIIPDKITRADIGILWIDGGQNTDGYRIKQ